MKIKALTSLCVLVLVGCSAMSRGPSDDKVKKDVELAAQGCQVSFPTPKVAQADNVKLVGRSIEGNTATIVVEITYHWADSHPADSHPAKNDHPVVKIILPGLYDLCNFMQSGEKTARKLIYRKYDTGWRLEKIDH